MLRGMIPRGILFSVAIHVVIVGLVLVLGRPASPPAQRQGEPLMIELPSLPEPAPLGNPAEPERVVPTPAPASRARAVAPRPATPPAPASRPQQLAGVPRPEPAAPVPPAVPRVEPQAPPASPPVPVAKPEPVTPPAPEPRVATPPRPEPAPLPPPVATPLPPAPVPEPPVATPAPAPPPAPPPPAPPPSAKPESPRETPAPPAPRVAAAPPAAAPATPGPTIPPVSITGAITPEPAGRAGVPRPGSDTLSTRVARAGEDGTASAGATGGGGSAARATPADRLALLRPRQPGGGLQGGRGGIEGQAIPLDTKNPKFSDYFEQLRRQIQEKWIYPREAGDKNVGGSLLIEFGIHRDGKLQFIELVSQAPMKVLDDFALNAVKLASPFPPVPPPLLQGSGLPVLVRFNYVIETGSLNRFLR